MARKRLSDLLREEVQKSEETQKSEDIPNTEVKQAEEITDKTEVKTEATEVKTGKSTVRNQAAKGMAKRKPTVAPSTNARSTTPDSIDPKSTLTESIQLDPINPTATPQVVSQNGNHSAPELKLEPKDDQTSSAATNVHANIQANPHNLELEQSIVQLKILVETTQTKLQQKEDQIDDLQTQLDEQQAFITTLKTELQKSAQLQQELEEAKQMILKLSALHSHRPEPTTAIATPPPPAPAPATPSVPAATTPSRQSFPLPQAAEPELESSTSKISVSQPGMGRDRPGIGRDRPYQAALSKILDHPTLPGDLPTMPSESVKSPKPPAPETDMGWVD